MNQILSVDNINNKKKEKRKNTYGVESEVAKIIKFFAIALIVFGIFNIGTGSYAMYKKHQEIANRPVKPEIAAVQTSGKEVSLTVTSQRNPINEIYYSWNDEEETKLTGNNMNVVTRTISIPEGENVLYVRAITTSGETQTYEQTFTRESKIIIQVDNADPYILVRLEGQDELSYMTYRWNDGEETKIENINSTNAQYEIETLSGKNTLTITAVDVNNETETKEININGLESGEEQSGATGEEGDVGGSTELTTKPSLDIEIEENSRFLIYAKDNAGLKRIELVVNGNEEGKISLDLDGGKEQNFDYPIEVGENTIIKYKKRRY